jgi:hypothetical protein
VISSHRCRLPWRVAARGAPVVLASLASATPWAAGGQAAPRVAVSFPASRSGAPLDGRLLLIVARDSAREPRFQVNSGPDGQQVFGLDVDRWAAGRDMVFTDSVFGFPRASLREVPAGEYWVQAVLNRYDTFVRGDGHTVKLPMDRGEGQHWNTKPGNLYSTPRRVRLGGSAAPVRLSLDQVVPDFPAREPDTKYLKHVRIQSERLTKFWGRPWFIEANVLLPEGWDSHPNAKYPLMVYQGHHTRQWETPVQFRETPPEQTVQGPARTAADAAYRFYQYWTDRATPRLINVTIQHANPYYDDSYAVNSENVGPYGDAITYELLPYIERTYRGIGAGWARVLYGGSTGGWESLGAQIFYPKDYNGAWAFCPDPVDFSAYTLIDLYKDRNAYFLDSDWKRTPRPARRNWLGQVSTMVDEDNHLELVLGSKSRSGEQWDIWEAVFSPVGADGYPKRIWDKRTGEIDHAVAEFWRDHYDLRYILQRDWKTLGPDLQGKLHIYVGDMDSYYLNDAVYKMEAFLESTKDPYYGGHVEYGDRFEHCWSGDHANANQVSRLTINQRMIPQMVQRMITTAPAGADVTSWRY